MNIFAKTKIFLKYFGRLLYGLKVSVASERFQLLLRGFSCFREVILASEKFQLQMLLSFALYVEVSVPLESFRRRRDLDLINSFLVGFGKLCQLCKKDSPMS